MRDKILGRDSGFPRPAVAKNLSVRVCRGSDVLHTAEDKIGDDGLRLAVEREIVVELLAEDANHFRRLSESVARLLFSSRIGVILYGNVFVSVRQLRIISYDQRD